MKNFTKCLFLLMLLFVLNIVKVQSQTTLIEDFEGSTCTQENHACEVDYLPDVAWTIGRLIDEDTCLEGWRTSHGTPSIVGRPYEGSRSMSLEYSYKPPNDTTKLATDGAFVEFDFEEDSCYAIIFWYQFDALYPPAWAVGEVLTNSDFKVALANGLTYNSPMEISPCYEEVPFVSSKQEVFSIGSQDMFEYAPWREAQFIVKAEQDFEYLWFYFNDGPIIYGDGQNVGNIDFGRVDIDNIVIRQVDCDHPCECETLTAKIGAKGEETSIEDDTDFNGFIPSGCYEVAGTLLIDETTSASGATFIMQPGAQIIVESGSTFAAWSSTFQSCIHMWKGVTVESDAILAFDNNEIYHAQYAIELLDGSSIWLTNNLFDRNYIGIYANHKSPTSCGNITQLTPMRNNEFTCSGLLLTPYDGQMPGLGVPGIESLAGIQVNNICHFNIGVSNNATIINRFHNMRNGILAWRSNMDVHHCVIANINGFTGEIGDPFTDMYGVGIYLVDCPKVRVTNNDFTDQNTGYHGIIADRTNGIILDNVMQDLLREIRCRDFSGNINGNILDLGRGIWVSDSYNKNISIIDNDIFVQLGGAFYDGIRVQNCNNSISGNFTIAHNTIETRGIYQSGIFLQNARYLRVQDNTIFQGLSLNTNAIGIQIDGSSQLQIRDNTITGGGGPNYLTDGYTGIRTNSSPSVLYCCNTLDNSELGLHILGPGKARVSGTSFGDHDRGLVYDTTGVTGHQGNSVLSLGNTWTAGTCVSWDAQHEAGQPIAGLSRYYSHASSGVSSIDPNNWFFSAFSTLNCETWSDCDVEEWLLPDISSYDTAIVVNSLDSVAFGEVVRWMARQDLYETLVENPSLYASNAMMEDFKDSTATSEIGRLYTIRSAFLSIVAMSDSLTGIVNDYLDDIDIYMEELDSLNNRLLTASAMDSIQIKLRKDTVLSELLPVTQSYNEEIDSFRVHRRTAFYTVKLLNYATTVSSHQAVNEKTVNEIELNYWMDDYFSLDPGDIADLYDIAAECPFIGGKAVFRARSLHDIVTWKDINWDSLANCVAYYNPRLKNPEEPSVQRLSVYPNPTDGSFTVELLNKADNAVRMSLIDLNGRKMLEQAVTDNPMQLDGSHLPQGIYMIQILLDSGEVLSGRIVILH